MWTIFWGAVTLIGITLSLPSEYYWLRPYFRLGAEITFFIWAGMLVASLRKKEVRASIVQTCMHPFQAARKLEPIHLIALGLVIAAIGVGWQLAAPRPSQTVVSTTTAAAGTTISDQERDFLDALRQFVLTSVSDAGSKFGGVFYYLRNIDRGSSGDAAFFVMEAVQNGFLAKLSPIQDIAKQPPARVDLPSFRSQVIDFFRSYKAAQDYIPKFVKITNVDPNRNDVMKLWLEADRDCLNDLKQLKARFPKETADFSEQFLASANEFDAESLSALIDRSPLPVSVEDRQLAAQELPQSHVKLAITNVRFDPNGPAEMYVDYNLRNPGTPTIIRNWRLTVYDDGTMIAAWVGARVVSTGKLVTSPQGWPSPENLSEQPLEQGGQRNGQLTFTFQRRVAADLFGKRGLRFRVTAEDVIGQQLKADFKRE